MRHHALVVTIGAIAAEIGVVAALALSFLALWDKTSEFVPLLGIIAAVGLGLGWLTGALP